MENIHSIAGRGSKLDGDKSLFDLEMILPSVSNEFGRKELFCLKFEKIFENQEFRKVLRDMRCGGSGRSSVAFV